MFFVKVDTDVVFCCHADVAVSQKLGCCLDAYAFSTEICSEGVAIGMDGFFWNTDFPIVSEYSSSDVFIITEATAIGSEDDFRMIGSFLLFRIVV